MSMRIFPLVLLLLAVSCCPLITKADTFDFSFATVNGAFAGSGTFDTDSFATDPVTGQPIAYSGFYISSLSGDVNGIAMVLDPGTPGSSMDYYGPLPPTPDVPLTLFTEYNFLNGSLDFTLDGQEFFIHDNDSGPASLAGLNLYGPGIDDLIRMTVTPAPEPSTLLSLLLGLLLVFGLTFRRAAPHVES
ncbi:MAG TPA: PEP-CTERM sorting domain-containing protein [Candidatus Acidoferrales bacterium]|jgi:hypothetical protein|nr:PEP-CTERM sorting domain-containing protein [Candidatus Acidoferrales bacterium]